VLISVEDPDTGAFTFANYVAAYGNPRHLLAFRNSLTLGAGVVGLCLVFGLPIAWAVSRSDMPGKGAIRTLILSTFITPPFLGAMSWILLAGPNAGWLNRLAVALTGASAGPFNIYSFPGLVLVVALYSFPYVFVFTSAALDLVSSEMEEAAGILGAGPLRTTLRVTLPLVAPAILAAAIITFLEAIALVGSPVLIALPARINLVTLQIWQFFGYPLQVEVAAAYAMPLLLVTMALFWLQRRLLGRKGYVTLSGKGGERRPVALGRWRWPVFLYAAAVLSLSVVLPYGVLLQAAFAGAWAKGFGWDNLTLRNFKYIIVDQPLIRDSMLNTLGFSSATATIAVALTFAVAYVANRNLVRFGTALGALCFAPFVIPGIVLAIGFYAAYAGPPLSLAGTATILILAFTTRFLPIAYANSSAAVKGLNVEMEEAVRILGGSRLVVLRRVVAPLLKRSLAGAWLLVFIPASRELSTAMFLYGPDTRTMSVMFFDLSEGGNFERLAAFGVVLMGSTIVVVGLGYRLIGRDFMLRRGRSD
jgi:iron(III) transport system permease protein